MRIRTIVILCLALGSITRCHAQQAPTLGANEIIARLIDRNSQRERLQAGYTGTRRYVLENQKFNKRAEMLVSVKCDPDGTKHFEVVSEEGWNSANKRVLRKMLESESETSRPQARERTSITPENYTLPDDRHRFPGIPARLHYRSSCQSGRTNTCSRATSGWMPRISRSFEPRVSRQKIPPSGPTASISCRCITNPAPSGSRSRRKA